MNMKKLLTIAIASAVMFTGVDASTDNLTADMNKITGKTDAANAGIVQAEIEIQTKGTESVFPQFTTKNGAKIASALEEYVHYISDTLVKYANKDATDAGKDLVEVLELAIKKDTDVIKKTVKSLKDIKAIYGKDLATAISEKEATDAIAAIEQLQSLYVQGTKNASAQNQFIQDALTGINTNAVGADGYVDKDQELVAVFEASVNETVELLKTKLEKTLTVKDYFAKNSFDTDCADLLKTKAGTSLAELFKSKVRVSDEKAKTDEEATKQMVAAVTAEFKPYSELSDELATIVEGMEKNPILNAILEDQFKTKSAADFKTFLEGMKTITGVDPKELQNSQQETAQANAELQKSQQELLQAKSDMAALDKIFSLDAKNFLKTRKSTDVKASIAALNKLITDPKSLLAEVVGQIPTGDEADTLKSLNSTIAKFKVQVTDLVAAKSSLQKSVKPEDSVKQPAGAMKSYESMENAIADLSKISDTERVEVKVNGQSLKYRKADLLSFVVKK